jgi:hypothetical protein
VSAVTVSCAVVSRRRDHPIDPHRHLLPSRDAARRFRDGSTRPAAPWTAYPLRAGRHDVGARQPDLIGPDPIRDDPGNR